MTTTVSIVLHDSGPDVRGCLAALAAQTLPPDTVVVYDNASADDGLEIARASMPDARVVRSEVNVGFAAGQNRAIAQAPADIHVLLNPDCRLEPTFLARAAEVLAHDPTAGSVSGRVLRFRPGEVEGGGFDEDGLDIIDSTGMVGLRNRRVLDRGSDERAAGRYLEPGYVFGVTGAAGVYRRAMLEDVAFDGEILDEAFFAFREDVDLAWRAQLLGWRCRYEPAMLARHRRRVAPGRRRVLPARVNRLSVANRWRTLVKNELGLGWRRDWRSILWRDAQILGYCLLREQRTLGAIPDVIGDRSRLRERRRDVMRRRVATDEAMVAWFGRIEQLPLDAGAGESRGA